MSFLPRDPALHCPTVLSRGRPLTVLARAWSQQQPSQQPQPSRSVQSARLTKTPSGRWQHRHEARREARQHAARREVRWRRQPQARREASQHEVRCEARRPSQTRGRAR